MTRTSDGSSWHTFRGDDPERVRVTEAALRHIFYRHPDLFDGRLQAKLLREFKKPRADTRVLATAADAVLDAGDGSRQPLHHDYRHYDTTGAPGYRTRLILLSTATALVLREIDNFFDIKTAFRPRPAIGQPPSRAWRLAREALVERCTNVVVIGGRKLLVLPSPDERFPATDRPGYRTAVCFHRPEQWGFRPIKVGEEILWVWQPPPWAASLAVPRGVLKTRKPSGE